MATTSETTTTTTKTIENDDEIILDEQEEIVGEEEEYEEEEESNKGRTAKVIAVIAIILLGASLAFNYIQWNKTKKLGDDAVELANQNSRLISANRDLERNVASLQDQRNTLDRNLSDAFENLSAKEIIIARLEEDNQTLKQIKSQVSQIDKIRNEMNNQLNNLTDSEERLRQVQNDINATINTKTTKNNDMLKKVNN